VLIFDHILAILTKIHEFSSTTFFVIVIIDYKHIGYNNIIKAFLWKKCAK